MIEPSSVVAEHTFARLSDDEFRSECCTRGCAEISIEVIIERSKFDERKTKLELKKNLNYFKYRSLILAKLF